MYVTKEQVEAMIALALANGPAAPGESTTDRQINGLAEKVKALDGKIDEFGEQISKALTGTVQECTSAISALHREVSDQSRRIGAVEKDIGMPRPSAPVEPGPMDTADDPGAVVAHAPEAAPQPVAVEPAQG